VSLWFSLAGHLPFEWARYDFMQSALLALLLIGPLCALLGCMVVSNQMAFYSEAMGHAALTGIAVGVIAGLADPTGAMVVFGVVMALAITLVRRVSAISTDTVIGVTMAFAVALGVVLLSRGGGFARYSRYLVGDMLTITRPELARLGLLALAVLGVWLTLFNNLFLVTVNRSLARSRGIRVGLVEALFAVLVAVVVSLCIPWVGILVINSLLILPAATARNLARGTPQYYALAVAFSLVAGVAGLVCSFYWDTATGATVVLFSAAFFALSLLVRVRRGA
jgi:zinc transport system permease protein